MHSAQLIGQLRQLCWLSNLNSPIGHAWHGLVPNLVLKNSSSQTRQLVALVHLSQSVGHGWQTWAESTKELSEWQEVSHIGFLSSSIV